MVYYILYFCFQYMNRIETNFKMIRFSFFVVIFLVSVTSSYTIKVVDVDAICKQTNDVSFCTNLLNSKPGGVGQDLVSLAQYTLDVVRSNTTNTIILIQRLIAQTGRDVEAQIPYKKCLTYFKDIIHTIHYFGDMLKIREYDEMFHSADRITSYIDYCLNGGGPDEPPYHGAKKCQCS
ncbi:hypothetical protein KIW84_074571 [Lathyrus oleraceus]|uniref:Pectinesterase inhibitor domain-containing protein n=1 Tax=Pisum sativum TaxID=3888 RepID=A0A9D4VRU8_PEA|nr:hypothetical protein KIW84_074571 [Pisum sativum]